ncbi:hypothetical protein H8E88_35575 [candidate division KSB1 bacterium]|nr:hypothetical protein [candidate division KSB1 bacterium]
MESYDLTILPLSVSPSLSLSGQNSNHKLSRNMTDKTLMYFLTFLGLYFELAGAFLLSVEAIGAQHLRSIEETLRKHRVMRFIALLCAVGFVLIFSKIFNVLHFTESMILILSLGVISDFAPNIIRFLVKKMENGKLGILGFLLFAIGFSVQAYVSLSLLY